ncbi:MAG: NYN domain-containing protein [Lachnospiraceae bacterium]|nr:NYN domain-containing protein [Lachnospiraceae bacterium]
MENESVRNLQSIAMLIDADNTQLSKIEYVIREISAYGRIVVKRAYGNWKKENLKNWESEIKRLAIRAEQQFDYVAGKNATDMALVIDTIELLYRELYDAFVIVASDSDYTPLAIKLHESGVYVIGVGEKNTPEAFRNACDEFIFLENLGRKEETVAEDEEESQPAEKSGSANGADNSRSESRDNINEIHKLLRIAHEKYQDADGYVNVSSAGTFIKRVKPDFDAQNYGYLKLPDLIEDFPDRYEMTRYRGKGTVTIVAYRCIRQDRRGKKNRKRQTESAQKLAEEKSLNQSDRETYRDEGYMQEDFDQGIYGDDPYDGSNYTTYDDQAYALYEDPFAAQNGQKKQENSGSRQGSGKQSSSKQNTARQGSTKQGSGKQNSGKVNSTKQGSVKQSSSKQNSGEREYAKRDYLKTENQKQNNQKQSNQKSGGRKRYRKQKRG